MSKPVALDRARTVRRRITRRDRLSWQLRIMSTLLIEGGHRLSGSVEVEGNNTLDAAQDLGVVGRSYSAEVVGSIGDAHGTSDDVEWFRFALAAAGRVQILSLPDTGGVTSPVVLTLYGDQLAEFVPDRDFAGTGDRDRLASPQALEVVGRNADLGHFAERRERRQQSRAGEIGARVERHRIGNGERAVWNETGARLGSAQSSRTMRVVNLWPRFFEKRLPLIQAARGESSGRSSRMLGACCRA